MRKEHIGPNDPCPCGSGREYRHCCFPVDDAPPSGPGSEIFAEIRRELRARNFATIEEANAYVADYMRRRNSRPLDEFCGLSPEQMHCLLRYPFDSPEVVTFSLSVDAPFSVPILKLFRVIASAIGEKGLKPTATGNLPRKLVQETAAGHPGDRFLRMLVERGGPHTETDFPDLHATRVVAELAGLVRKYRGKFILGRHCRKIIADRGTGGAYPLLLAAYAGKFNWGYQDRYPELDIIQESFLFTLYLLHRFGGKWRPNTFYEDAFLRAFPQAVRGVRPIIYGTPEKDVRSCYSRRCLERFAAFLGLAEINQETYRDYPHSLELRKSPLLDQAVKFRL